MGISVEQWRQRIGTFSQPVRSSKMMPKLVLKSKYLSLGIRNLLFLMLVVQDVESNPGLGSSASEQDLVYQIATSSNVRGRGRGRGVTSIGRGEQNWQRRELRVMWSI